ncbi:MAG: hypothetical protein LBH40_01540 [Alphaproteobacteria bacterium]|nr:hypothetical protein [Alphaproteobacteria bacterium]
MVIPLKYDINVKEKVFIIVAITGTTNFKERFQKTEDISTRYKNEVLNPTKIGFPSIAKS